MSFPLDSEFHRLVGASSAEMKPPLGPWAPTLSVEDLPLPGTDLSTTRGVSGVLCLGHFDGRRQALLLPSEPLRDLQVDPEAYALAHLAEAVVLEPVEGFVDVVERLVPGMLVGGASTVVFFQPAVVRARSA